MHGAEVLEAKLKKFNFGKLYEWFKNCPRFIALGAGDICLGMLFKTRLFIKQVLMNDDWG